MELQTLEERWLQLDKKIEENSSLLTALVKSTQERRADRLHRRLAFWPILDLAFGIVVLLIVGSFLGDHRLEASLSLPALAIMPAVIFLAIDNIRLLVLLADLSWDGPIASSQVMLSRFRQARIRQFKWIILLSPLLWICLSIVFAKKYFDINIIESTDPWWVASNLAFGVFFIPGGIWIARSLSNRWRGTKFWQSVLDSISGRGVVAAQRELQNWAEIESDPPLR
jgi:hypothetical protein